MRVVDAVQVVDVGTVINPTLRTELGDAVGVHVTQLPLTAERVLAALRVRA